MLAHIRYQIRTRRRNGTVTSSNKVILDIVGRAEISAMGDSAGPFETICYVDSTGVVLLCLDEGED
ncbi:hypothetical protein [Nocardia sp. NPDC051570]|uniref:hypothetical protein n=1 Tax=Nocardia sp. NPDC051570 TaxID=3364324 RepID=UPI0037BD742A